MLCVTEIERSRRAYAWLMPEVGYATRVDYGRSSGWFSATARLWIRPQDPKYAGDTFSKDRVGLCELCFGAPDRAAVDRLARALPEHGFGILDAPKEYPYSPGTTRSSSPTPTGSSSSTRTCPG